jgi:hypothetical protein
MEVRAERRGCSSGPTYVNLQNVLARDGVARGGVLPIHGSERVTRRRWLPSRSIRHSFEMDLFLSRKYPFQRPIKFSTEREQDFASNFPLTVLDS